MTKAEYREYLKTDRWRGIRREVWRRDDATCQRCYCKVGCDTGVRGECHHVRYTRILTEWEIYDVILVCERCHRAEHGLGHAPTDEELLASILSL